MILHLEEELIFIYAKIDILDSEKNILRFCIGGILHLMTAKDIQSPQKVVILLSHKYISLK